MKERRGREERLPRGNGALQNNLSKRFQSAFSPRGGQLPSQAKMAQPSSAAETEAGVAALKGQGVAAGPNKTGGATFENGIKT